MTFGRFFERLSAGTLLTPRSKREAGAIAGLLIVVMFWGWCHTPLPVERPRPAHLHSVGGGGVGQIAGDAPSGDLVVRWLEPPPDVVRWSERHSVALKYYGEGPVMSFEGQLDGGEWMALHDNAWRPRLTLPGRHQLGLRAVGESGARSAPIHHSLVVEAETQDETGEAEEAPNLPPILSARIQPERPNEADDVVLYLAAEDPEGGDVSFQGRWRNGGEWSPIPGTIRNFGALAPGAYTLEVQALDSQGGESEIAHLDFDVTVVPDASNLAASVREGPSEEHPGSAQASEELAPLITNTLGMTLRLIPAGTFLMGNPEPMEGERAGENPQHEVTLTEFYIGTQEVTVAQYQQFVEATEHPAPESEGNDRWTGQLRHPRHPVVYVSWDDANAFCSWLTEHEGRFYTLPTEAQWEYACRAGTTTRFHFGDHIASTQANFDAVGDRGGSFRAAMTHLSDVGRYAPNAFGLFDMHGNAAEWTQDFYATDWYERPESREPNPVNDQFPEDIEIERIGYVGPGRVLRGGSWNYTSEGLESTYRSRHKVDSHYFNFGFRVAIAAE